MAKSKKRNTKKQSKNDSFQPLNMFFGGPRGANYSSISNVSAIFFISMNK